MVYQGEFEGASSFQNLSLPPLKARSRVDPGEGIKEGEVDKRSRISTGELCFGGITTSRLVGIAQQTEY